MCGSLKPFVEQERGYSYYLTVDEPTKVKAFICSECRQGRIYATMKRKVDEDDVQKALEAGNAKDYVESTIVYTSRATDMRIRLVKD